MDFPAIVIRYSSGGRPGFWLPAGRVDKGETLQEAQRIFFVEQYYLDVPEVGSDRINGDRINGLFHLFINGVYWGFNPLTTVDGSEIR